MDFAFSDLNLQLDGLPPINFNPGVTLPGHEAPAAFAVNSIFLNDLIFCRVFCVKCDLFAF